MLGQLLKGGFGDQTKAGEETDAEERAKKEMQCLRKLQLF